MLPVVVTTCKKYKHLIPDFFELANKFWDEERTFIVDVAQDNETWTQQLNRVISMNELGYFIRMSEDFYLHAPVDKDLIAKAEMCAMTNEAFRFSLQCVSDGFEGQVVNNIEDGILVLKSTAPYSGSMEASILNGDMLREVLMTTNEHVWEFEHTCTNYIKDNNCLVLVPEKRILHYKDATRRGEVRIRKENGQYLILKPGDVWETFV